MTQKDRVAGTALLQPAADALHLGIEPSMAQALLEFSIFSGGPYGEHPIHLESGTGRCYSAVIIKTSVIRGGKSRRAIIHVKQYGVELADV